MRNLFGLGHRARRRAVAGGLLIATLGALTACSTSPASPPQATLPAVTQEAPPPVVSPPAASPAASPVASPVAGLVASPVASPIRSRGARATPVCSGYAAWASTPEVKAALEKTALWPEVVAEAEKAAAGQPVNKDRLRQIAEETAEVSKTLRASDAALTEYAAARHARHAMALASRLAGDLADGKLDRKAAGAALAELRDAISTYDAEAAAMQRCD